MSDNSRPRTCLTCDRHIRWSNESGICTFCEKQARAPRALNVPHVAPELLELIAKGSADTRTLGSTGIKFPLDHQRAPQQPATQLPKSTADVPPPESHVCPQCRGIAYCNGPKNAPRVFTDHEDWCPFAPIAARMRKLTRPSTDPDRVRSRRAAAQPDVAA